MISSFLPVEKLIFSNISYFQFLFLKIIKSQLLLVGPFQRFNKILSGCLYKNQDGTINMMKNRQDLFLEVSLHLYEARRFFHSVMARRDPTCLERDPGKGGPTFLA